MTEKSKEKRITGSVVVRMLEILILSAAVSIGCFCFFYLNRFRVQEFLMYHTDILSDERDEFIKWMNKQSRKYKMYPTGKEIDEADREMIDKEYLPFLFEHHDPYASFWIYNDETGKYVTGYIADVLADKSWLLGSSFLEDQVERVETRLLFQDGTATLIVESYRVLRIFSWYMGGAVLFSILLFLLPVIIYIYRRMKYLKKIRQQALEMAVGNLEFPITVLGNDEISSLAQELDYLRCTLKEQMEEERKSYQANRELIRAVSHDLRTPLTTLYGYLEILNRGMGKPEQYGKYLKRCLDKTEEIRNMSDRMFEYTLVFEGAEEVEKQELSFSALWKEFENGIKELKEAGFIVEIREKTGWKPEERMFQGNPFLLKRLSDNLFSNIRRYGDKTAPVSIEVMESHGKTGVVIKNRSLEVQEAAGSGVGLKSARRIADIHKWSLNWKEEDGVFSVVLLF
ncbi:MAG: HAMP domain-containing sensor histidine kinase [Eubacteriales bacterium]|nr:HAMP domain-containing sensor histidine kinase [Eubacteriales bacterium]